MASGFIDIFLQNLRPNEVRTIKKHIRSTDPSAESRTMEVFEKMVRNEPVFYNNINSLNKLKSRILEKSLDALMIESYFEEKAFSKYDYVMIKLKKQIIQCRLLQRNLTSSKADVINHLLHQIITEAKKYELYSIVIEALTLKKYFSGLRNGMPEFKQLNKEIAFYEVCYKALENGLDCYMILILNYNVTKNLAPMNYQRYIEVSLQRMEKDYKKTYSQSLNYYISVFKFALYEARKDYNNAIAKCEEIMFLLKQNDVIYRPERMGFALSNLSLFHLKTHNYAKAIEKATNANEYYLHDSFNSIQIYDLCFVSFFRLNDHDSAANYLEKLLSHPSSNIGTFRKSKHLYYKACLFFSQGKFKEARSLLIEPLEIEKDKTRWNISLRILNIMIFIELGKKTEAASAAEALRKFLERTGKVNELKPRDLLIARLLKEMEKNNFDLDEKNGKALKLLSQLSDKDSDAAWEPFSSELIPFHEWVEERRKQLF